MSTIDRIDKLTPEQTARMASWAQEWIKRGLSCEPADRATFEAACQRCYEYAGLKWHGNVVWVGSPIVVAMAGPIAAQLVGSRRDAVWDAVGDAVWGAVEDAVWDAVGDAVVDAVVGSWWRYLGGSWWLSWQAYTSFFRDVCGLQLPDDLWDRDQSYAAAQSSAGWWWPHSHFVIVSDHPSEIHTERVGPDGRNSHRLHNDNGPSISFRDGWALYHVHGVRVPEYVVAHPERITVLAIESEANAEVRRVMMSRYGEARYIQDCGAQCIHRDEYGELYRREIISDEPLVMVRVLNSTPEQDGTRKPYWLRVHPELRPIRQDKSLGEPQQLTARNAIASVYGYRGEEYLPQVET